MKQLVDAEINAGIDSTPKISYNGNVVEFEMKKGESIKLDNELDKK